jgi:hypothetical protein
MHVVAGTQVIATFKQGNGGYSLKSRARDNHGRKELALIHGSHDVGKNKKR